MPPRSSNTVVLALASLMIALAIGFFVGVFAAGFGRESLPFRVSAQLEAAAPWRDRRPPVGLWNLG